jgi:hypothetical protein
MDLTVHQKLESIREDINSKECKGIMKQIKNQKGDLYDALGLGFAVEAIHRDKPFSRDEEDENSRLEKMRRFYGGDHKKSSGSMKNSDRNEKKEYEKNMTHDEVRQQYFDNLHHM